MAEYLNDMYGPMASMEPERKKRDSCPYCNSVHICYYKKSLWLGERYRCDDCGEIFSEYE